MSKIAVRVDDDQRRELAALARRSPVGLSRSDLIRIAINKLIEHPEWLPGGASDRSAAA